MSEAYNPLDKVNLGKSVAEALLDREAHPLGELPTFEGAGIYVIYYDGDHPAYRRLSKANREEWRIPIYIGKAIPSGGRRGAALLTETRGRFLYNRLREHAESVQLATNLDIDDFAARWLVVDDIWIPLGETLLISKFHPVWNRVLDGFGNHDPGSGRYGGMRPMWDVLHPGRAWATRCRQRPETASDLEQRVQDYLASVEMPKDAHIRFAPPGP
jgi:hypothetical protein